MAWVDHVLDGASEDCRCHQCGGVIAPRQIGPTLTAKQMRQIARDYVIRTSGRLRLVGDRQHPFPGTRAA